MSNEGQTDRTDYVTIIGTDMAEITRQFLAEGLSRSDYAIVHGVGRHRFTRVDGEQAEHLFDGRRMIAATFARRTGA